MFILETNTPPATVDQLTAAITSSLKKSIAIPNPTPVSIAGNLPNLDAIAADISNGKVLASQQLHGKEQISNVSAGPTSASIKISGNPVHIADIPVQMLLEAQAMKFDYGTTPAGQVIAIPKQATDGRLNIKIAQNNLDKALLLLARKFSAKQSVEILKVETNLNATSPTNVNLQIKITAKKFMKAVIEINGQLQIDDRMRLTTTNLKATSTGMVGNVAVGLLQPQLNKLEGRPIPLLKYSLGDLQLRSITIDTDDGLSVSAFFGSKAT